MFENVRAEISIATACPFCGRGNLLKEVTNGEARKAPTVKCKHCGGGYRVTIRAKIWHEAQPVAGPTHKPKIRLNAKSKTDPNP